MYFIFIPSKLYRISLVNGWERESRARVRILIFRPQNSYVKADHCHFLRHRFPYSLVILPADIVKFIKLGEILRNNVINC
jgi:hypothetical protein